MTTYENLMERMALPSRTAPMIVRFGSDRCQRCPAVAACMQRLEQDFDFEHVYVDASESEATEHFLITKLPALVGVEKEESEHASEIVQPATEETATRLVKQFCERKLTMLDDF